MGKDNVYFHVIYFPSVQLGDGRPWTMLHHLSTTGQYSTSRILDATERQLISPEYLNYEGGKFSKSHNRGVFGPAAKETGIPPSVWRYYLISTRPETADAMFSWADCVCSVVLPVLRLLTTSLCHRLLPTTTSFSTSTPTAMFSFSELTILFQLRQLHQPCAQVRRLSVQ